MTDFFSLDEKLSKSGEVQININTRQLHHILRAVTDAENGNVINPYKLRLPVLLKSALVTARSIVNNLKTILTWVTNCYVSTKEHEATKISQST